MTEREEAERMPGLARIDLKAIRGMRDSEYAKDAQRRWAFLNGSA